MDRRLAAAWMALVALVGCGGGGGSASPAPAPAPAPAVGLSGNLGVWGDSEIPPIAANLQFLMPDRVVYDGGVDGETSTQVATRLIADTSRHSWITIWYAGGNNVTQPQQTKADIANSIASLTPGNNRFIILSQLNEATPLGIKGGANYPIVLQLNADLFARYPLNFLDIRTPLVAMYDPNNPQDVIDHNNDVIPSSIRFDEIHLRQPGSALIAAMVRDFIAARGW
jgi:lysophospholipase L1-like esterase